MSKPIGEKHVGDGRDNSSNSAFEYISDAFDQLFHSPGRIRKTALRTNDVSIATPADLIFVYVEVN